VWMPEPEPGPTTLVADALLGMARRPTALLDAVRLGRHDVLSSTGRLTAIAAGTAHAGAALIRRAPSSPLEAKLSQQRRLAISRTRLTDYRQVHLAHAVTVNDVVLATVAGALRSWMIERGDQVVPGFTVRALVPVSVNDADSDRVSGRRAGAPATQIRPTSQVAGLLVDLPVSEADPVQRLLSTASVMAAHRQSGRAVSAEVIVSLGGFAPPTLHTLGARAANGLARRMFNLVITNVPGPQVPLYAAGARMVEMFPVLPLAPGRALSIGLTSYDGGVFYGINGDRDAMPDVAALAGAIEGALAELVEVSSTPDNEPPMAIRARRASRQLPARRAGSRLTRKPPQ
nr:WS/DGAT domain-containing protein [Actinomycetota bacterium]